MLFATASIEPFLLKYTEEVLEKFEAIYFRYVNFLMQPSKTRRQVFATFLLKKGGGGDYLRP